MEMGTTEMVTTATGIMEPAIMGTLTMPTATALIPTMASGALVSFR